MVTGSLNRTGKNHVRGANGDGHEQADHAVDAEQRQGILVRREHPDEKRTSDRGDRNRSQDPGQILQARHAPAAAVHALPGEHQRGHGRERRADVNDLAPRGGQKPVIRLQAHRHVRGGERHDEIDENDEEPAPHHRQFVNIQNGATPDERELVVAEPADPDDARQQQRTHHQSGFSRVQEDRDECGPGTDQSGGMQE